MRVKSCLLAITVNLFFLLFCNSNSLAAGTISVTPTSLDFGNQQINTASAGMTITISNTLTTSLNLSALLISGDYSKSASSTCGDALSLNKSCNLDIVFTPTALGTRTGSVTFATYSVPLTGVGVDVIAPTASITGPLVFEYGQQGFTLDGAGSYDIGTGITKYRWRSLDATFGAMTANTQYETGTSTFNVSTAAPIPLGTYTFELIVVDGAGNLSPPKMTTVTIRDTSLPTAILQGPLVFEYGQQGFTLDGTGSYDIGTGVTKYRWRSLDATFGAMTVNTQNETGTSTFNVSTAAPIPLGTYTFELIVVDGAGNLSLPKVTSVTIRDTTPPKAVLSAPQTVLYGQSFTLDGSLSTDAGSVTKYRWTSLDGTFGNMTQNVSIETTQSTYTVTAPTADLALGSYRFQLVAADTSGNLSVAAIRTVLLEMDVTPDPLPPLLAGQSQPISVALSVRGGTAPYTFTTSPDPSAFSTTGVLVGSNGMLTFTNLPEGTLSQTVLVSDSSTPAQTVRRDFTFTTLPSATSGPPNTPVRLPAAQVGLNVQIPLGGFGLLSVGNCPPGMFIMNGALSGTPTTTGLYVFTLDMVHSGYTTQTYYIEIVNLTVKPDPVPHATVGLAYNQPLTAAGGIGPYTISRNSSFPAGLDIVGNAVTGNPAQAGTYLVEVAISDSSATPVKATQWILITVDDLTILQDTLPPVMEGQPLSSLVALTARGGTPPYTFSASSDPAAVWSSGVSIQGDGMLSFANVPAGTHTLTVVISDSSTPVKSSTRNLTFTAYGKFSSPSAPVRLSPVVVGQTVRIDLTGYGYTPPTFTVPGSSLPPGLVVGSGEIVGTPATIGMYEFVLTITYNGVAVQQTYFIEVVNRAVTLDPVSSATVGLSYSQPLAAAGYTVVRNSAFPPGLDISNNIISGTPTQAGNYLVQVAVSASPGSPILGTQMIQIIVDDITILPATLPPVDGYSSNLTAFALMAIGGTPPYTFSVPTYLPYHWTNGVGIESDGLLTFASVQPGSKSLTVMVTDSSTPKKFSTRELTFTATQSGSSPPNVPIRMSAVQVGQTVYAPLPGYTSASLSYGSTFPPGLSVSNGVLMGTPVTAGMYTFTFDMVHSGYTTQTYWIEVTDLRVSPDQAARATVGLPYSQPLTVSGPGPYTITRNSTFPPGLDLVNNTISGTPTRAGKFLVPVAVSGSPATSVLATQYIEIIVDEITILPGTLPPVAANSTQPSNFALTAIGGTPPYSYSLQGEYGNPGVTISANGMVTFSAQAGTYTFTVMVTDTSGRTGKRNLTFTATQQPAYGPQNTPIRLPGVRIGQQIRTPLEGYGPPGNLSAGSNMPIGLYNFGSVLMGTPLEAGLYQFSMDITHDGILTRTYFIEVSSLTVTPDPPLHASTGLAYSQPLTAAGGNGPYTISRSSAFPPGLDIINNAISGTPTKAGSYLVQVSITDSSATPLKGTQYLQIIVDDITILPDNLPPVVAHQYQPSKLTSFALTAQGGTPPYSFSTSPNLNDYITSGVTISSNGMVTFGDVKTGVNTFTVLVSDSSVPKRSGRRNLTFTAIEPPIYGPPNVPIRLATAVAGQVLVLPLEGYVAPGTLTVDSFLPPGLSLANGILSGTPTTAGIYVFTLELTHNGYSSQTYFIEVSNLTVTPDPAPHATVGLTYSQPLTAVGGVGPYTISSGSAFPAGLSIVGNAITGIPTQAGNYLLQVAITDSSAAPLKGTQCIQIVVDDLTILPGSLPPVAALQGQSATFQLTALGGTPPYTFSSSPDTTAYLVNGVMIGANGLLTFTSLSPGPQTLTVMVTDSSLSKKSSRRDITFVAYLDGVCRPFVFDPPQSVCNAGTQDIVTSDGAFWSWHCAGLYGGSTASCSSPIQYLLHVVTTGGGSGKVTGSSTISGQPGDIDCPGSICTAAYRLNVPVTLDAQTSGSSTFLGWSGGVCSGVGPCHLAMVAEGIETATFGVGPATAKIASTGYASLNAAYSAAGSSATITVVSGVLGETLDMNRGNDIVIKGGYDSQLGIQGTSPSILSGKLIVRSGSLRVGGVTIRD